MSRSWLLAAVCGVLALPTTARAAEPADAAAAQAQFERGRRAAAQGDWALACASFAESQRLDPGAGTLMNWATCEARQGKLASAWQHFHEAAALLQSDDDRTSFVQRQIHDLARRLPRLTLHLSPRAPRAARVLRNGTELGQASLGVPLPVDPGRIELLVTCEGRQPRRSVVTIVEGQMLDVTLDVGVPSEAASAAPTPAPRPQNLEPPTLQRDLGMSLVALGSLGVGLGLASGLVVSSRRSTANEHCPAERCDEVGLRAAESGERWLAVNTVSWSVGAVALVTGGALWLTSPSKPHQARLTALPGGAALSFAEHF